MSFTTVIFFLFLAGYLVFSSLAGARYWKYVAFAASSVFYGYWDWRFLILIWLLSGVTWFSGKRIYETANVRLQRRWLTFAVASALIILGLFKYFNFFLDTFVDVTSLLGVPLEPSVGRLILPVGISFYTFQALSYTIDIYRRDVTHPASLLDISVFLLFFPQLVAGPIVRAKTFLPQIERGPLFCRKRIQLGLVLIAWGYFLKLCLADFIGLVVDPIFGFPQGRSSADLLAGVVAYSFQIYGDFAGYSLIAIGIAKLQGFDFPANFWAPYFSRSFSEFWRRWHISLSSWLRDYLYIPLGGNRGGRGKQYRNLMLTMLLGGLWHGASYNFVFWGWLHGVYLIAQRALGRNGRVKKSDGKVWRAVIAGAQVLGVYACVLVTWIFFRIADFDTAVVYLRGLLSARDLSGFGSRFELVQVTALILFTVMIDFAFFRRRRLVLFMRHPWMPALGLSFLVCTIELAGVFGGGAFIYFQF